MSKFEAGQPKPTGSGRKPGTPNTRTRFLAKELDVIGLDVPQYLAGLIPKLSPEKQADVLMALLNYIYPKRKPTELAEQDQILDLPTLF